MGFYINKLSTVFWTCFYRMLGVFFFTKVGSGCRFQGWVDIPQRGGQIIIGQGVLISKNVEFSVPQGGALIIGDRCSIGRGGLYSAHEQITIGADTMIAEYVCVHDNNHVFMDPDRKISEQGFDCSAIYIGRDCWIGAQSVVLKGSRVDDGSVVGAQTLVNRKHEPRSVLVGVPARAVAERRLVQ